MCLRQLNDLVNWRSALGSSIAMSTIEEEYVAIIIGNIRDTTVKWLTFEMGLA